MPSFQALYNSLSGLFAFSKSLDTISNNVANLNTPGFQGSESFYENVMDEDGVRVDGSGINTAQGQMQQTGNATDVAIKGTGLFVLRDTSTGEMYYTRAGQFTFNSDGYLVDTVQGYRVQGLDADGKLVDINISNMKSLPAEATSLVKVSGNLLAQDSTASISSIKIYDAEGTAHTYTAQLTKNNGTATGSWQVSVLDGSGTSVGSGEIRFDGTGAIQSGYNTVDLSLTLAGQSQDVTLSFGAPGTTNGTTQFSGLPSSLTATPDDGHGVIGVSSLSFDESGVLNFTYTDQEKKTGPQLALATFDDNTSLQRLNGRLYQSPPNQDPHIGAANKGLFGTISGSTLEMSNVDLSQELGDMIVIQRGYQASSRVMTVSDQMLQQLYNATRGG
ncbi:flagellar hook protein FlgE [Oleiagrimonas citrea]|uniref:Flagellar basal-body rod protein FlgF n=1 Tax=Oleiagrimonas citrea TaxID=1665687 RepID=A0A846ZNA3_9GAMM|nr:flagellar basal-body rod protein FlgF [Oleiagrimonas citrea]NKZ39029.1 flagellar basal-body rod protein FlgF [Oleiagrimonas citrea]